MHLCSLKVKKQMNGSSGQMLMWTSAVQTAVPQRLTAMPPSTRGARVLRGGPEPVHSGAPEEEAQRRGPGQMLITERSELASAADCRRASMLRMHLMKKRIRKSLRRCWFLLLRNSACGRSSAKCMQGACHHSHSIPVSPS